VFDSARQEEFCDALGRELLVPRELAVSAERSTRGLLSLQAHCDVSLEVAARAMSSAQQEAEIAIWFRAGDALRLQWRSERGPDAAPRRRDDPNCRWLADRGQLLFVR
jgi:hypothetical protein